MQHAKPPPKLERKEFFLTQNLYFLGPIVFQLVLSIFQCIKNLGAKYVTAVFTYLFIIFMSLISNLLPRETYGFRHVFVLEFSVPL